MKKKVLIIGITILTILLISILILLINNKTFFKTTYVGVNNQEFLIPKYSYFKSECCMTAAIFYSFRSERELKKEIDEYMKEFKYFEDEHTYGYKKDKLFIQSYEVESHLLYRKIIIVY